jgi:hypothetical protein
LPAGKGRSQHQDSFSSGHCPCRPA